MQDAFGHRISYLRVSITDRCNERCAYCMPHELQVWQPHDAILTYEEICRILRVGGLLGLRKVRITGGEPLTRRGVLSLFESLRTIETIEDLGVSTNGTLLARNTGGRTMAMALRLAGVRTLNISLDTLEREKYAAITGRDYLPSVFAGIAAAKEAGFESIKLNCVLMRGQNDGELPALTAFASANGLLLRFIELMPVSTSEVLSDANFLPAAEARRIIEAATGPLIPEPSFRTNGPAAYYQIASTGQRLGFIGAMTDLRFCESCNKLRLTADGKLRPCLGSHLEFDLKTPMRHGASDDELQNFLLSVVANKPKEHDFRNNYQPGRQMVAIGG